MAIGDRKKSDELFDTKALQERRNKRALRLFTNRDDERDLLKRYFHTIGTDGEELEGPVLNFWGVGGVGKSTLLKRAWEEFEEEHPDSSLRLIHIDLDSDKSESLSPIELLWKLRSLVFKYGKVSFPLFDLLYVKYKKLNDEPVDVKTGPLLSTIEKLRDASDIGSNFADVLEKVTGSTALTVVIGKHVISAVWGKFKQSSSAKAISFNLDDIDELKVADFEKILPEVLAAEMGAYLVSANRTICIALDGYERVRKPVEKLLVEHFISRLLTNPDYYPHVGILVMGRNELDWSEYDSALQELLDDGSDEHWNPYLDQHRLGGLSKSYAKQFLDVAVELYQEEKRDDLATLVRDNRDEIAAASMEAGTEGTESYHPFHLDLCLEQIEKQRAGFDAGKHLGKTPKELRTRFLKYLDDNSREWHYAFALCGEFDEELFSYLVDKKSISGSLQEFYRFVLGYSYVTPQNGENSFKFHRLMQNSLIADIASRNEIDRDILRKSVLEKLIGFYDSRFVGRKLEALLKEGFEYYQRATDMLIHSVRANVISLSEASQKAVEWDKAFSSAFLPVRELCVRKWLLLKSELLGDDTLQVADSLYALGLMLAKQGKYDESEQALKSALETRVSALGEDHSQVSTIRHELALVLKAKGNYIEAKEQLSKSLWIKRHSESLPEDRFTKLNNLALILMTQRNYDGAVRLLCKSLAMKVSQYGESSSELVGVLDNLAIAMDKQCNYHYVYALHNKSLEIKRACYGNVDLSIAKSLSYLGFIMDVYANDLAAEKMLRESLGIYRQMLGDDNPEVATGMKNLAVVLAHRQQYVEAESLFREAISLKKKLHGEPLDVADCIFDLAMMMEELKRYQEAELLLREALQIARRSLGDENDRVVHFLYRLMDVLRRQGKVDDEVERLYSNWSESDPFHVPMIATDLDRNLEKMALGNDAKEMNKVAEASKYDSRGLRFRDKFSRANEKIGLFERLEALDEQEACEMSLKDILIDIGIEADGIPAASYVSYDDLDLFEIAKIYIPSLAASIIDATGAGIYLDPYSKFDGWIVKGSVAIANGSGPIMDSSLETMLAWAKIPFLQVDTFIDYGNYEEIRYSIFCPGIGGEDDLKLSGTLDGDTDFDMDDIILAACEESIDFNKWNTGHDWAESSKRLKRLASQAKIENRDWASVVGNNESHWLDNYSDEDIESMKTSHEPNEADEDTPF
ncbi:tetratricopeptide repeat protein [Mariprofundus erugo]|uniref:Tetratricopeptide repeat protein n=1 Tax=Mariprofundus erugo TaxID=2528639 RepID=A0A5R9GT11_9PROT|nr:tetratricopeptide repeat protein [Mariprofundus erugo]TLS68728.1 tetratricopeptide repeat protein [Mariprofundus erugo]